MANEEKLLSLNTIFTPSSPIDNIENFSGRENQLNLVIEAIQEKGKHAIIFGKRGAGKTSLANILPQIIEDVYVNKLTCNHADNFMSIWEKMLRKIKFMEQSDSVGYIKQENIGMISLQIPDKEFIDAGDLEEIFIEIETPMLLIFDEFDTITDENTRIMMADTIKSFSDNVPNVSILIVGIAKNVDELIGHHPSIERCVKQIHLPEMSKEEINNFISSNMKILDLEISNNIIDKITEYSSGYPHYTHALCKFSAQKAIAENSQIIDNSHFNFAVEKSIQNSDHSLKTAYELAVKSSSKKNQFFDIIYACAIAKTDEFDSYSAGNIIEYFNKIRKSKTETKSIHYNLGMLCRPERGVILEKFKKSGVKKYRFVNPLMKAFIKLNRHKIQ